jgi:hypothetical protein
MSIRIGKRTSWVSAGDAYSKVKEAVSIGAYRHRKAYIPTYRNTRQCIEITSTDADWSVLVTQNKLSKDRYLHQT